MKYNIVIAIVKACQDLYELNIQVLCIMSLPEEMAGRPYFFSDADRMKFLDIMADTVQNYNWLCHAYCLLDNHYHLIIETPDPNLYLGMRQLNGVYTQSVFIIQRSAKW